MCKCVCVCMCMRLCVRVHVQVRVCVRVRVASRNRPDPRFFHSTEKCPTPLAQAWEGVVQGHTLREGGVGQPRLAPLSHHHHALSPPPRSERTPLAQVWEGVVKAPAFQGFKVEKCESVEHAQQVGPWGDWKPIRNCP